MQIGRSASDAEHSLENRYELREEANRRLEVTCELSSYPQRTTARILKAVIKAVIKRVKKLFVRFLLWLHFPFTH
jgi:hypothetical protein